MHKRSGASPEWRAGVVSGVWLSGAYRPGSLTHVIEFLRLNRDQKTFAIKVRSDRSQRAERKNLFVLVASGDRAHEAQIKFGQPGAKGSLHND
jgi:hypothetical protein